ncbi:hypothetical protein BKA67DRAFT_683117 [Truncatella angustata]|uniref:2EXR domain-containing protein n=1 Tax=Truncatella angustata TaxID=152316 RepID=A0A9P8RKR4_9PEZI|nr:uncharacterized protein BKA67DRAFT_683117 [Truncatella angustata]KAH6647861.1 hypothetical protein BKA67DRAFT_683117 [Truncatella angustata]
MKFTKFPCLPPELRDMIWQQYFRSLARLIPYDEYSSVAIPIKMLAVQKIDRESYFVFKRVYDFRLTVYRVPTPTIRAYFWHDYSINHEHHFEEWLTRNGTMDEYNDDLGSVDRSREHGVLWLNFDFDRFVMSPWGDHMMVESNGVMDIRFWTTDPTISSIMLKHETEHLGIKHIKHTISIVTDHVCNYNGPDVHPALSWCCSPLVDIMKTFETCTQICIPCGDEMGDLDDRESHKIQQDGTRDSDLEIALKDFVLQLEGADSSDRALNGYLDPRMLAIFKRAEPDGNMERIG